MTQHTWNRRGALAAGSATLAAAQASAAPSPARPNILWLVSEDNNPFIGVYGDTLAHTPTIDALARTGVRYANAFSSAPVCAPTRFSILTGLYAETCGPAHHMRAKAEVPPEFRTYPELLRAAGYHCTNNAKTDYNCTLDPAKLWDESSATARPRRTSKPAGPPTRSISAAPVATYSNRRFA